MNTPTSLIAMHYIYSVSNNRPIYATKECRSLKRISNNHHSIICVHRIRWSVIIHDSSKKQQ